ncbi:MAG: hypothetical protein AB1646_20040 [Thermodesulfobacteriota bacterium]
MRSRLCALTVIMVVMIWQVPGHAFVDFLFGGSSNRGAIENSAIGDLRAWYTGNPVYQFNPFYSRGSDIASPVFPGDPQQQNSAGRPQASPSGPVPQPTVTYFPPNPGQGQYYGPAPQEQAMYGQPMQQAPGPQYQPQYQQPQAQYPPQQYQQPVYPPQQYQQPAPAYQGGYQAGAPAYPPQGGMPAVNQYQQPSYQGAPMAPQGYYQ